MGIKLATRTYKGSLNKLLEPFGVQFESIKSGGGRQGIDRAYRISSI